MLIKKIVMNNFRQFKETETIEFSTSPKNNVTIIMGENGAGKTTLAQAFLWVLYGETDFKDKKVVNKKVIEEALDGESIFVRVDLYIEENNIEYQISRYQRYIKKANKVDYTNTQLEIRYKDENGVTKNIEAIECKDFINNILPNELSRFFFFDGERIKNMSNEIEKGKSQEFAEAVNNLVGLNAIKNARDHIRDSRGSNTVIGQYNKKIDESGNFEILRINAEIDKFENATEEIENEKKHLEPEIEYYQKRAIELEQKIMDYSEEEKLKAQYQKLKEKVEKLEENKKNKSKAYLKYLNSNGLPFFLIPLIRNTLKELKNSDKIDKGIPHIHEETIKYLFKRGKCICGHNIEPGSDEAIELTKLLDFIPPKSIGTSINNNIEKSKIYLQQGKSFYEVMNGYIKDIRKDKSEKEIYENQRDNIYNKITDIDALNELKFEKNKSDNIYKEKKERVSEIDRTIGSYKEKINLLKKEKDKYINIDKDNKKYILYREYARAIYEGLDRKYSKNEEEIRKKLEVKINEIFCRIFDGGLSLKLDEKYNIKVTANELVSDEDIERSTAQNYSVIFAFIAGIIEIAKEKGEGEDAGYFDTANNYPLVMDAPLSAFDKTRIEKICNTIPKIAQQVIFFIKDTDGNVAEEHLKEYIGKKYEIIKDGQLNSFIKERA